jgi:hypothetical protein
VIWHDRYMLTVSNDQVAQIPKWLKRHHFRLDKSHQVPNERIWVRGCCQVRIRNENGQDVVEIGTDNYQWTELGQLLANLDLDRSRDGLVSSPIEIAVSNFLGGEVSKTTSQGELLYSALSPMAYVTKAALQMFIGLGAVATVCVVLALNVGAQRHGQALYTQAANLCIHIITAALAAAAAVELAYTLFTPGPDEALDPLMLGLSAGILLLITRDHIPVGLRFLGIIIGVIALGALFFIRRRFLDSEES